MNNADEQAAQDYYSILLTYIRELSKAHKGIRRLVRRNRKLEAACLSLRRVMSEHDKIADWLLSKADERLATLEAQKQSLRVGQYKIAPSAQHGYVIQIVSGDGEGEAMGVKEADFVELIDRYYKENF